MSDDLNSRLTQSAITLRNLEGSPDGLLRLDTDEADYIAVLLDNAGAEIATLRAQLSASEEHRRVMREALEHIETLSAKLRYGGPDSSDLNDLSDALQEATDVAHEALSHPMPDTLQAEKAWKRFELALANPTRVEDVDIGEAELYRLNQIADAAEKLSFAAEEYDFDDGLGMGAPQEYWDALSQALEPTADVIADTPQAEQAYKAEGK